MYSLRTILRANYNRQYGCRWASGIRTALYDFHVENGGKMVDFAGFALPVVYRDSTIVQSHLHTRQNASLFDVSHMLQTEIKGKDSGKLLESITTGDLQSLTDGAAVLTVFTNASGGILDDLIITKIRDNHYFVVSNASMRVQDSKILNDASAIYPNVNIRFFDVHERSLLALQGPEAAAILQPHTPYDLNALYFMQSTVASVCGVESCRLTRCGYTGEDGFEISVPAIKTIDVAGALLSSNNALQLAGLGVRDSLRLEAGLCLYGNDIDTNTTPIEAGLAWLVAKRRRQTGGFPGDAVILNQLNKSVGVTKKRVGLLLNDGGPPARRGVKIFDENDQEIGQVTSGGPSPSLGKNIAMGYIETKWSKQNTQILLDIRNKQYGATITRMPFVHAHYYVKKK